MRNTGIRSASTRPDLRATPAARLLSPGQKVLGLVVVIALVYGGLRHPRATATIVLGAFVGFYLLFALLKMVVTLAGRGYRPLRQALLPPASHLPHYGVLLPVHKEANMLRRLVARIDRLDYPRDRLHVYILIEHDDKETLAAAAGIGLRFHGDGNPPY